MVVYRTVPGGGIPGGSGVCKVVLHPGSGIQRVAGSRHGSVQQESCVFGRTHGATGNQHRNPVCVCMIVAGMKIKMNGSSGWQAWSVECEKRTGGGCMCSGGSRQVMERQGNGVGKENPGRWENQPKRCTQQAEAGVAPCGNRWYVAVVIKERW